MAIDKRLQIYDEQGNLVDYDILASDVKFLPDGKDLPTKIAEMQDEIDDAGSGDGTVTGVKIGSTTYEPTDGVVDLSSPMSNKVDKNGTDSLMTAAEHTKLAGIADGAQVNVINSISVNGTPVTPNSGNVNIVMEGGGSVESVTVSGTKYTPDINGDVNLGDLRGQDGNSGVASADGVESVNNLNGGTIDTSSKVHVLGANQGKRLRDQMELIYQRMQTLYGLLGNIAFWDGKPASSALLPNLDWGAPKHKVTLSLSLTNAVVKDGLGNTKVNGAEIQVEEGGTLTLTVEPASGYALTGEPTVSTGATVDDNQDGTYSVAITMGQSDMTLSISATGAAPAVITIDNQVGAGIVIKQGTDELEDGDTVNVAYGGTLTLTVEAASGYEINSLTASIGGSSITPTESGGVYTISAQNITSDATLSIGGRTTKQPTYTFFPRMAAQVGNGVVVRPNTPTGNNRATLLVPNSDVATPTDWNGSSSAAVIDVQRAYSLIPIPSGATTFKIKLTNNIFKVAILLAPDTIGTSSSVLLDSGWLDAQAEEHTINLTNYSTATQMGITLKHADDTTPFVDTDTLGGLGLGPEYFSFRFE